MNWRDRFRLNPSICQGKVCIKGTRMMASVVLDDLASGETVEAILRSYRTPKRENIQAALVYAPDLARDRVISIDTGA